MQASFLVFFDICEEKTCITLKKTILTFKTRNDIFNV